MSGTAGSFPTNKTLSFGLTPILKDFDEGFFELTSKLALYAAGPGPIDLLIGILFWLIPAFYLRIVMEDLEALSL
jgi:hypothetical protein